MSLRQFQVQQQSSGAVFEHPEENYPLASHFGSPEKEYQAARESAAVFDLSNRDQIELSGTDRLKFLHNFCTNDIKGLQPDQGCEAFVTNVQSRILGQINAFSHEESIWIDTAPGQSENITQHLDRYIILEDVRLLVRTQEFGSLYLSGPRASEILKQLDIDVDALEVFQQLRLTNSDARLTVRRVDWFGQPGYLCCLQYVKIADFWNSLLEAGAVPAGQETFDAIRIESLFPVYGVDLTDANLAQEASRTAQSISFKKGCYLGQEPIARIDSLGHVNKEIRSIGLEESWVPPAGSKVMVAGESGPEEAGTITSSARSFGKYSVVAMGVLRKNAYAPGTTVEVVADDQKATGTVFTELD
ncbi:CAF17-like 4Fe-4S cluster assembly/insertion protein YgfZ [Gimesia algae]|uniref:Aminomethyltransferase n=1 Tax=Gimesia algae TaxID=2527971 RepID=A0A517VNH6_9PLAN|nr:aminomethyltransferase family protein [Gimesia algae]QDT94549.1 Aminomethyltransferase [Gimesia algae]